MANILKLITDGTEREIATRLRPMVNRINGLEARYREYSDEQLRECTAQFRGRLDKGESLDSLVPDAFAAVREAGRRKLNMRHFDVQLMGGLVLHQGRIAEMRTGEGKTLVATCPLYVNALLGKGAHLVTVNPYLAKRDATWMGAIFHALGMTVGILQHRSAFLYDPDFDSGDPDWPHVREITRKEAYQCDITYGMNSEYAFDYLYDNMTWSVDDIMQRGHHYAIVDEVDSILIDEARTPHIVSGEGFGDVSLWQIVDAAVARLNPEVDFTVEEKQKTAVLTEEGTHHVEALLKIENLTDPENIEMMHHVQASLRARFCHRRDVDYVVKDGQVLIVDEMTGRIMPGRRWSDGLHQAVEAKEGVKVEQENQTIATITIQNFFRLYHKLGGMTGTAKTEEGEFRKIYGLDVVTVPTNVAVARKDYADMVFKSEEIKFRGVSEEILKHHVALRPVLVGTKSIAISERLSRRLAPDRLQLLAAISLLRSRIESDKLLSADAKREMHTFLNRRFYDPLDEMPRQEDLIVDLESDTVPLIAVRSGESLHDLRDLASMATKVTPRLNLNMLLPENITEYCQWLEVPGFEEPLAAALRDGISHEVLNAKYHEREAAIIAQAGRLGSITIATNMAGRGVDILLGGRDHPDVAEERQKVLALGGLHIIGSERHENRRIDNQLRGRSGRQGDPGSSRYFVSLEDELWRLFGDRTKAFGMNLWEEWLPIDNPLISRLIERTQKKVELYYFDIRKNTLQYDEVLNDQRTIVYRERRKILDGADLRENIERYMREVAEQAVDLHCSTEVQPHEWNYKALWDELNQFFPLVIHASKPQQLEELPRPKIVDFVVDAMLTEYQQKEQEVGSELMREVERHFALQFLTNKWMEHLEAMDYLREGIGLRGYGQIEPVLAYRREGSNYFYQMINSWKRDLIMAMFQFQLQEKAEPLRHQPRPIRMIENISGEDGHDPITEMARGYSSEAESAPTSRPGSLNSRGAGGRAGASNGRGATGSRSASDGGDPDAPPGNGRSAAGSAFRSPEPLAPKVGRNDPCPCGSGKKYKKCHGAGTLAV